METPKRDNYVTRKGEDMSKEAYTSSSVNGDIYICQKRHIHLSKETYISVQRDACKHQKDGYVIRMGEAYKKCPKRHIYLSKETHVNTKETVMS